MRPITVLLVVVVAVGLTSPLVASQSTVTTTTSSETSSIQSDALSFAGQQAIAHAGLIFATLTAAFAFGTGFKKLRSKWAKVLYLSILGFLLTGSIYAGLRLYWWGQLSQFILTFPPEAAFVNHYCNMPTHLYTANISKTGMSAYWQCVIWIALGSNWILDWIWGGGTAQLEIAVIAIAFLPGFLLSAGILHWFTRNYDDFSQQYDESIELDHGCRERFLLVLLVGGLLTSLAFVIKNHRRTVQKDDV